MALVPPDAVGATADSPDTSLRMAFASAMLKSSAPDRVPPGPRNPWPGRTMSRLLPSFAMSAVTWAVAPAPTVTMVITAPTPMTMPRMVRDDRSALRRIVRWASRKASQIMTHPLRFQSAHPETGSAARHKPPCR